MKATDGFIRAQNNPGAVINTDLSALEAYKRAKLRNKDIDDLKSKLGEVDQLKSELTEIKGLLQKIVEKIST